MLKYFWVVGLSVFCLVTSARADQWPRVEQDPSAPTTPQPAPAQQDSHQAPVETINVAPGQHPVHTDPLPSPNSDWIQHENEPGRIRVALPAHPTGPAAFHWPTHNVCMVAIAGPDHVQETLSHCDSGKECPYAQYDTPPVSMARRFRAYFLDCVDHDSDSISNATWTGSTWHSREYNEFDFAGHHFYVDNDKACDNCVTTMYKVYPATTDDNGNSSLMLRAAKAWQRHQQGTRTYAYTRSWGSCGGQIVPGHRPDIWPDPTSKTQLSLYYDGTQSLEELLGKVP